MHLLTNLEEKKLEIKLDCLLLVEGKDEYNFFCELGNHIFGCKNKFQIINYKGKSSFRKKVKAFYELARKQTTLQSIGVIRDADDDPNSAFQSVYDAFSCVGYKPHKIMESFHIRILQ